MKAELGQAVLGIVLIVAVLAIAFLLIGMAANQHGMQAGAEAIGESVGEAIENYTFDHEIENIVWHVQNGVISHFWVSQQKLYPNKHAIETHGDDAWAATNCYNNNGAIQMWMINPFEFHLLCQENDGTVRDIILGRNNSTSNRYFLKNAFTPKDGTLKRVLYWIEGRGNAVTQLDPPPTNIIISIDKAIP